MMREHLLQRQDKKNRKDALTEVHKSVERDRQAASENILPVLLFLVLGILLFAFVRLYFSAEARLRRAFLARFRIFAGASQLTRDETRLFQRIAEHYQLPNPSLLFVKRSVFEAAAASFHTDPARMDAIRRKVYSP